MRKIVCYIAITFIVFAVAVTAGCIGEKNENPPISKPVIKEFDTSAYVLTDVVNDTADQTIVSRTYTFKYGKDSYVVNVQVPQYRINNYKDNTYELYDYQRGFVKDEYLEDVVEQIQSQLNTNDRQKLAKVLISFVQKCIKYNDDQSVHGQSEYWAYPVETLVNGQGDCDCIATLMTAMLRTAGFDALTLIQKKHLTTIVSDIEPYGGDDTDLQSISYKSKDYYFIDGTTKRGVGHYSQKHMSELNEYYGIYEQTQWSAYLNGTFEEGGMYQNFLK